MPDLSVIIPTFNNRGTLAQTLDSLFRQSFPAARYEIIVLDDGSTDGTREMLQTLEPTVRVWYERQENRGRSAARNAAARLARGKVLLFLDADILAGPDLLARHQAYYERHDGPIGVQGRTIIHPDCKVTFFMQTKEITPDLTRRRRDDLSPYLVLTRNLSVRAADFWAAGGFDEEFVGYGWEDIELGLRMHANGVRFFYDPHVLGFHYEIETLQRTQAKLRQSGESAVYFWRKLGSRLRMGLFLEIHPLLLPLKWAVYRTGYYGRLVRRVLPWAERRRNVWIANECYNYLIWESYYEGVFPALRNGFHPVEIGTGAASLSEDGQQATPTVPRSNAPLPEPAQLEP